MRDGYLRADERRASQGYTRQFGGYEAAVGRDEGGTLLPFSPAHNTLRAHAKCLTGTRKIDAVDF